MNQAIRPVLTCDVRISINISIRSLCASEDSRDISISISFLLTLMVMLMPTCPGHHSDISISIRRTQAFVILTLMLLPWPSSLAHKLLLCFFL